MLYQGSGGDQGVVHELNLRAFLVVSLDLRSKSVHELYLKCIWWLISKTYDNVQLNRKSSLKSTLKTILSRKCSRKFKLVTCSRKLES